MYIVKTCWNYDALIDTAQKFQVSILERFNLMLTITIVDLKIEKYDIKIKLLDWFTEPKIYAFQFLNLRSTIKYENPVLVTWKIVKYSQKWTKYQH